MMLKRGLQSPPMSAAFHGWKFGTPGTGAAFAGHAFSPGRVRVERSKRVHHAMHEQVEHFRLSDSSDEESVEEQSGKRVRRSGRGKDKAIASREAKATDSSIKLGRSKFMRQACRVTSKVPAGRLYGRGHCELGNGEG